MKRIFMPTRLFLKTTNKRVSVCHEEDFKDILRDQLGPDFADYFEMVVWNHAHDAVQRFVDVCKVSIAKIDMNDYIKDFWSEDEAYSVYTRIEEALEEAQQTVEERW